MSKKIVLAAALALVVVGISASNASASCSPPKASGTYNSLTGAYTYWSTTIPMAGSTLVGKIWDGAGDHTGTCNTTSVSPGPGILYWSAAGNSVGYKLGLGDACVTGCPSGFLSLEARVKGANGAQQTILVKRTEETPSGGLNFDFSLATGTMCNLPCPTVVTSSSVDATHKSVTLAVAALDPTCVDATAGVTGWNIVSAQSPADPGTDATLYSVRTFLAAPNGAAAQGSATLDCTAPTDQWVTMQMMTTAGGTASVCPARRVNCNPLLADPKFKGIAPKKTNAPGQISK